MFAYLKSWALGASLVLALASSCGGESTVTNGSESHFLDACGADDCGDGLSCVCGVCTRICGADTQCGGLSNRARCVEAADIPAQCADVSPAQGLCDAPCETGGDCASLGTDFECRSGVCRTRVEPPIDVTACGATPSNSCKLVSSRCCACEPYELADFLAVESSFGPDFAPSLSCEGVLCAPCPPAEATRANFDARCEAGHCQAFDVRESDLADCSASQSCVLRAGVGCCQICGDPNYVVAISSDVEFNELCASPLPCPSCVPTFPPDARAVCTAGRCEVVRGAP